MATIAARLGNARNRGRAGPHVLNVSRHREPSASLPLCLSIQGVDSSIFMIVQERMPEELTLSTQVVP